jgi:hypothetical protein
MSGDPVHAKIVETPEFIDSLKRLKRTLGRLEYESVVRAVACEATRLSDHPSVLPRQDLHYPDDPETRVHPLLPGFVLTYSALPETKNLGPRILLKPVLRVQEKK